MATVAGLVIDTEANIAPLTKGIQEATASLATMGPAIQQVTAATSELEQASSAVAQATQQTAEASENAAAKLAEERAARRELARLMREGRKLTEDMKSEVEEHAEKIDRLNKLLAVGAVTQEVYNRAMAAAQANSPQAKAAAAAAQRAAELKKMADDAEFARFIERRKADDVAFREFIARRKAEAAAVHQVAAAQSQAAAVQRGAKPISMNRGLSLLAGGGMIASGVMLARRLGESLNEIGELGRGPASGGDIAAGIARAIPVFGEGYKVGEQLADGARDATAAFAGWLGASESTVNWLKSEATRLKDMVADAEKLAGYAKGYRVEAAAIEQLGMTGEGARRAGVEARATERLKQLREALVGASREERVWIEAQMGQVPQRQAAEMRRPIVEIIGALEQQSATAGMTADQIQLYTMRQTDATEADIRRARELQKSVEQGKAQLAAVNELQRMRERAETFGMDSDEIAIFRARQAGVTASTVALLEAQVKVNKELEKQRDTQEEIKRLYDETRTPAERMAAEMQRITELAQAGADPEAVRRAAERALGAMGSPEARGASAALEAGSAGAYSLIVANRMGQAQQRQERLTLEQLGELRGMRREVQDLVRVLSSEQVITSL